MSLEGTMTADTNAAATPSGGESQTEGLTANNETEEPVNLNEIAAPEADPEPGPVEDDLDDWEDEGKQYRVPKKLKEGFMKNVDYTRKTQEVAETRRALEAERETLAQQAERAKQFSDDQKRLIYAEHQLEQFGKVNWDKLYADDPLEAPKHWMNFQRWQQHAEQLKSRITQHEQDENSRAQQALAKRVEDALTFAEREIKGWKSETPKQLEQYALKIGFTPEQINSALSPAFVKAVHSAWMWDQLQQKQSAPKPSEPPPPELKPTVQVTQRASGTPASRKTPANMEMGEFATWLKSDLEKRARR